MTAACGWCGGTGSEHGTGPCPYCHRGQRADARPCGCPLDYHLSDCPILTERRSYQDAPDPDDWYERGEW